MDFLKDQSLLYTHNIPKEEMVKRLKEKIVENSSIKAQFGFSDDKLFLGKITDQDFKFKSIRHKKALLLPQVQARFPADKFSTELKVLIKGPQQYLITTSIVMFAICNIIGFFMYTVTDSITTLIFLSVFPLIVFGINYSALKKDYPRQVQELKDFMKSILEAEGKEI